MCMEWNTNGNGMENRKSYITNFRPGIEGDNIKSSLQGSVCESMNAE